MRSRRATVLAGSSLLVIASIVGLHAAPVRAAGAPEQVAQTAQKAEVGTEEIVVTARRRAENLQDVPETVNAVTSSEIQKLNLLNLTDVAAVTPGLVLNGGGFGYNASASIRGVSFDITTQTSPTVAFYINDAPVEALLAFTSLFDVGQIEVLHGPQGTLRGEPAPSGSITITTHKADLDKFGGNINVTATHFGNVDANGAVNIPIVKDKLAVRVAGVINDNDYDGVHSLNNPTNPYTHTNGGRVGVRFEPNDDISTNVTYQHIYYRQHTFTQVEGPGAPGGVNPNAPAGYNGPAITPQQRLAVTHQANEVFEKEDIVTGQLDWRFAGQQLSYVGSWSKIAFNAPADTDPANQIAGGGTLTSLSNQNFFSSQIQQTHELRLASNEPNRFWDYTAGAFFSKNTKTVALDQVASYLSGAFGSPLAGPANPFIYNPAYRLLVHINAPGANKEFSLFGHVTFHLTDNTELSAGGRYIIEKSTATTMLSLAPGALVAVPIPAPCSFVPGSAGSTYPGTCNFHVPGQAISTTNQNETDHPAIFSASLSHKFNDDLMVYGSAGSAWRPPVVQVGISNAAADPTLSALTYLKPEKSYSFEGGFKTSFLDHRGRLNASYYHQIYKGLIYKGLQTLYLANNGAQTSVMSNSFTDNANAKVDGVDVDTGFQITPQWSVDAAVSYVKSALSNASVPCSPPGGGNTPAAFPAGTYIFLCKSHASVSTSPNFTGTLQSEYVRPITSDVDAFVRGLFSFYGRNTNQGAFYAAPAYGLVNLFVGLRSPDSAWSVTAFVKNAFNTQKGLGINFPAVDGMATPSTLFGSSGYYSSGGTNSNNLGPLATPRQEFGLTVSYAFGSR
ncbi:MAG: TonB-dependent receptor [Rhodospirillaceae bacterium]|nr:MAG: TonB-dependent receptor [Rhodospirillaceae bacterium]